MSADINVLLIEKDVSDVQRFEQLIDASDFAKLTLFHAGGFHEAIKALHQSCFEVILLNLCLPDVKGVGLIKRLKSEAPQTPIVAVDDVDDLQTAIAAIQEGAQDYLVKKSILAPAHLEGSCSDKSYKEVGNRLIATLRCAIKRAELSQQLEISQQRYELAVKGTNDGIWDWDLQNQRIYYSERWQSLLGLSESDMNDSPHFWFSRIHPNDRSRFQQQLTGYLDKELQHFECEHRMLHSDGTYRWMLSRGVALWSDQGRAYRIAGSQTDITSRKSLENSLYQEKELAQITLHSIGDAVITTDSKGYIQDLNPIAERLTGWKRHEAQQKSIAEVYNLVDNSTQRLKDPAVQTIAEGTATGVINHCPILISKHGRKFAIRESTAPIRSASGETVGTVVIFHDVTEERMKAKRLAWQVSHDPLTHLYNRSKFQQSLNEIIEDAHTHKSQHVLCCMDLDNFKSVNDTCGHAAGDLFLQQIAHLWRSKIRSSDLLARLGGDEFGLILYDCNLASALKITNALCESLRSFRFVYEHKVFNVGVSIGVAPITRDTRGAEEVLRLADGACYEAKNKGRNRVQVHNFDPLETNHPTVSDGQRGSRLVYALENDQFCLYKQAVTAS
ncbi:PAS fold family [Synechococcus sp. PCC 7335]|uniref:diguanylate cyclase n=1 Tax=Synechococcus sp. (strain ATCC 29403 / PCC 7335) TaxID=91464 RepID=UPI00017EB492|nr:diguanylate cyclase [Synechococcus sp. PCC 7335]EDX84302.1 PAS fold family [Synechococcus sp. PCC 7335]